MARMQKKKPAELKKKNKEAGDSVSSSVEKRAADSDSNRQSAAGSAVSSDALKKAKQAYSGTTRRESGQSAVLKLVDRYFGTWIQFLREVKVELSKVAWPTRRETVGTTAVVLIFVFIVAIFLGLVDMGLSSLVRLIL